MANRPWAAVLPLLACALVAQGASSRGAARFQIHGHRIEVQRASEGAFHVEADLPSLPGPGPGAGEGAEGLCWDGAFLYRARGGEEGTRIQCAFAARPSPEAPRPVWHWRPEVPVPDGATLLGGWEGKAVVALPLERGPEAEDGTFSVRGWSLEVVDLADGSRREVFRQATAQWPRFRAATVDGDVFIFTSSGAAMRVDCLAGRGTLLTSDFWKEAGIRICREPGSMPNPDIFGRPFFDQEGAILLAVEPKVFLSQSDILRAWGRLDEGRKRELIEQGHWPVPPGKEVGWKSQACFLRNKPETRAWSVVADSWGAKFVEQRDVNFIKLIFKDGIEDDTPFALENGMLIILEASRTRTTSP